MKKFSETTSAPTDTTELQIQARQRAGTKLVWLFHALLYLVFNGAMLVMFLALESTGQGVHATALAGGACLLVYALVVCGTGPGSRLREWLTKAEIKHLQGQRDPW